MEVRPAHPPSRGEPAPVMAVSRLFLSCSDRHGDLARPASRQLGQGPSRLSNGKAAATWVAQDQPSTHRLDRELATVPLTLI